MDSTEIRRINARKLAATERSKVDFAEKIGKSPAQVGNWIGPNPTKSIGNDNARLIEKTYKKPRGWLDTNHTKNENTIAESTPKGGGEKLKYVSKVTGGKRVPIVGTAQLGDEGFWLELEHPIGYGDGFVIAITEDPNAYALEVRGTSMHPAIRDRWIVVIEPSAPLIVGEYVMVKLKDGRSTVKELLFKDERGVTLHSINEEHPRMVLDTRDIETIHYVGNIIPPSKRRIE